MGSEAGKRIINRFPKYSLIKGNSNPIRELIVEGVGRELDVLEELIFESSDNRFVSTGNSRYLDIWGELYNLPRGGLTDDEYRTLLLQRIGVNITVNGLKQLVSTILGVSSDLVIILDGHGRSCSVGDICTDRLSGDTPCHIGGYYGLTPGIVTIKIPENTDKDLLSEDLLSRIVLAGVTVHVVTYTL